MTVYVFMTVNMSVIFIVYHKNGQNLCVVPLHLTLLSLWSVRELNI